MAIVSKKRVSADLYEVSLNGADITAGFKALPFTPQDPTRLVVEIIGGVPQRYNVDYTIITGNILLWNALGMQTVLSAGNVLRLVYYN